MKHFNEPKWYIPIQIYVCMYVYRNLYAYIHTYTQETQESNEAHEEDTFRPMPPPPPEEVSIAMRIMETYANAYYGDTSHSYKTRNAIGLIIYHLSYV